MSETAPCPNCGAENAIIIRIDAGLKLRLQGNGMENVPSEACENCHRNFAKMISKGALLRAEEDAKEQNRLQLWRNRVNLVRQAKQLMSSKSYSDAAVSYEKYLRILEIVYDKKPGELSPDVFKDDKRKHEITVIASVYWDLMRIYDVHDRYTDRQKKAAEKLAIFARYTPVFANIVRKAESQSRNARNPSAFKYFLKLTHQQRPRCFIATSAFGGRTPEVEALCHFRDNVLKKHALGRTAVYVYYRLSPEIAQFLDAHPTLKPPVRKTLTVVANCVGKKSLNHRVRS